MEISKVVKECGEGLGGCGGIYWMRGSWISLEFLGYAVEGSGKM